MFPRESIGRAALGAALMGLLWTGCRDVLDIQVFTGPAGGSGGAGGHCVASYDNGLLHEGSLKPIGETGGTTTTTSTSGDAGAAQTPELPACSSFVNPVLVVGSDSVPPVLKQIGPSLAADELSPITVLYLETRSCAAIDALYGRTALEGTACYYAADGETDDSECGEIGARACTLGGLPVDVAVSDVFPETCDRAEDPAIEHRAGPIQAAVFLTTARSSQEAISWEAARASYDPESASIAPPWDDENLLFQRITASGTQRLIAEALDLDPNKLLRGVSFSSSSKLIAEVEAINDSGGADAERVLGIYDVSNADRRTKDGQVGFKVLAYQKQGAACAVKPDANGYDKANVRKGAYDLWSPLHFVRRKGTDSEKAATRVLDLILMDPKVTVSGVSRADVFTTWVTRSFVPECAMEWRREGEMSELLPHETSSCKNAFECTLQVNGTGACARCDEQSSACKSGSHCDFRFGYCEDN